MFDELVIIAPIAPMGVGDRFDPGVGTVPLHLTVLPKVRVPHDRSATVSAVVDRIAAATGSISVVAEGRDGFGQQGAVRVTTVELSGELQRLHDRLRLSVRDVGAESIQPAYNGTGYRPHITDTRDGHAVGPGERILLTALAILDCTQPVRVLTTRATLSGPIGVNTFRARSGRRRRDVSMDG